MWLQADRWMIGIQSGQLLPSHYTVIHLSLFRSKLVRRHSNIGATLGLAPLSAVILRPAQVVLFVQLRRAIVPSPPIRWVLGFMRKAEVPKWRIVK